MKKPQVIVRDFVHKQANGVVLKGQAAIGKGKNGSTMMLLNQDIVTENSQLKLKLFHGSNPNVGKSSRSAFMSVSAADFQKLGIKQGADINEIGAEVLGNEHFYIHSVESVTETNRTLGWSPVKYRNGRPQLDVNGRQIYRKSELVNTFNGVEKPYLRIARQPQYDAALATAEAVAAPTADAILENVGG